MTAHAEPLSVCGELSRSDAKRLTMAMRGSTVGPTTTYYAGVTAPVIGAGMALLASAAFERIGTTPYWKTMLSAILAALAGIVWYLIFMRWSYRHRHGRASEMEQSSEVILTERYVAIKRGHVETRIAWSAVRQIERKRASTFIRFEGADPVIVPDKWFDKDKALRDRFVARLKEGMG